MKETKNERFRRIVVARVNKIIKLIQLIGNCANTANYEYSTQEVEKVFSALRSELDKAEKRFADARDMKNSRFTLEDDVAEEYSAE